MSSSSELIEHEPGRLREVVAGIGPKRAERIAAGWADQRVIREIMLFLHDYGVGTSREVRIFKTYGPDDIQLISENPWQLVRDTRRGGSKPGRAWVGPPWSRASSRCSRRERPPAVRLALSLPDRKEATRMPSRDAGDIHAVVGKNGGTMSIRSKKWQLLQKNLRSNFDATRSLRAVVPIVIFALIFIFDSESVMPDEYYAERTVWDRLGGGHLNISSFSFRDINRNGIYDMADQPMAGVIFKATGGGKTTVHHTNKSGFGNFTMSVLDREQDIVNRGEYTFLAVIPRGWLLTTDNASQRTFFDLMPGAPADMVSSTPMQPVGLAQELTIRGTVSNPGGAESAGPPAPRVVASRVRAVSPAGRQQEIAVDRTGSFSFAATPGHWTVVAETSAGDVVSERQIEVGATPVVLAALTQGETQSGAQPEPARPGALVSFDDLVTTGIKEIPAGYHDLNWRNWVVTHHKFYEGEGYMNTTVSGEFVAYNSSGHPVMISRERPFDFIGGYFGSAWLQAEGERLRVKGWRGATLVYDETIKLSALGPVYFFADFHDVTQLEFSTHRYWQFVCDNLEFDLSN